MYVCAVQISLIGHLAQDDYVDESLLGSSYYHPLLVSAPIRTAKVCWLVSE